MTRTHRVAALARLVACSVVCSVALGGCMSAEDRFQTVTVSTVPEGASCAVERGGAPLGTVSPTPGQLTLERGTGDIDVACTKDGHRPARVTKSAMTTRTADALGAFVLPAGYAAVSTSATYTYPPRITVHLDPAPAGAKPRR